MNNGCINFLMELSIRFLLLLNLLPEAECGSAFWNNSSKSYLHPLAPLAPLARREIRRLFGRRRRESAKIVTD